MGTIEQNFAAVLRYDTELIEKYDPNEPRDARGRWTFVAGEASKLYQQIKSTRSTDEIIAAALPDAQLQAQYKAKMEEQHQLFLQHPEQTTKGMNVLPGTKGRYTPERLQLHHRIVSKLLENQADFRPEPGQKPTVTFLGGRGGSGKSSFDSEALVKEADGTLRPAKDTDGKSIGVYDSKKALVLDADKIKELIPGYDPQHAATFHEESGDIFNKVMRKARRMGLNIVLDITMKSDKLELAHTFQKHGYELNGYFVHRPPDMAAQSAVHRWNSPYKYTDLNGEEHKFQHGRIVPPGVILNNKKNEHNFDRLIPLFKKWAIYDNSQPGVMKFRKVASSEDHQEAPKEMAVELPLEVPAGVLQPPAPKYLWAMKYDKDQPRVPAGSSHGGEFTANPHSMTFAAFKESMKGKKVPKSSYYNREGQLQEHWSHQVALAAQTGQLLSPEVTVDFLQRFPHHEMSKIMQARAAEKPKTAVSLPDISGWKRVGQQKGSNPGGIFQDEAGGQHYVKFPQVNPEQAQAEHIANSIYRELDIPVKETQIVTDKGRVGIAGKMVDAQDMSKEAINASPDVKKGYVADAYLGNWDVFGMTYDNILHAADGRDYRIDNGGTSFFRAQGQPKDFPADRVDELKSLIGQRPDGSRQKGYYAYGNLPKEEVQRQANELVTKMTDAKLEAIVSSAGLKGEKADRYLKALKGRREVIRKTLLAQKQDFAHVLKINPYRNILGQYTSKELAVDSFSGEEKSSVLNGIPLRRVNNPDFSQSVKPDLKEPPLNVPLGMHASAGVIMLEPDGRVWVYEPESHYAGIRNSFSKGTVDEGESLQQTAVREAWEETGILPKIDDYLGDFTRTTSVGRYYIGHRIGGKPTSGPETAAVKLVHPNYPGMQKMLNDVWGGKTPDHNVLAALKQYLRKHKTKKFDPNQPRDAKGQWTEGTGTAVQSVAQLTLGKQVPPKDKPVVLVFGGSFNPPHAGHVQAAHDAVAMIEAAGYKVGKVVIAPTADKLLKAKLQEKMYPLAERTELAKRTFPKDMEVTSGPGEEAEKTEGKLRRTQLADYVQKQYPDASVVNVTGQDAAPGSPPSPTSLYAGDPGSKHEGYYYLSVARDESPTGISSTKIRAQLAAGQEPSHMSPEAVTYLKDMLKKHPEIKLAADFGWVLKGGFNPAEPRDAQGQWTSGAPVTGNPAHDFWENGVNIGIFNRPKEADSVPIEKIFSHKPPSAEERKLIMDKFATAKERGVEEVKFADLIPMQDYIEQARLNRLLQKSPLHKVASPPAVFYYEGKNYLMDGHHRAAQQIVEGDKEFDARVYVPGETAQKSEDPEIIRILQELAQKYDENQPRDKAGKWVKAGWYRTQGGHHLQVDEQGIVVYGGAQSQGKPADPKHLAAGPFKTKEEAYGETPPAPKPHKPLITWVPESQIKAKLKAQAEQGKAKNAPAQVDLAARSAQIEALLESGDAPVHARLQAPVDKAANDAIIDKIGSGPDLGRAKKEFAQTPTQDLQVLAGIKVENQPVYGQASCSFTRVLTMGSTSVTGDFRHELGHAIHMSLSPHLQNYVEGLYQESMARAKANPAGMNTKKDHEFYETEYGVIGKRGLDNWHENFAEHYRGYQKAVYRTQNGSDPEALNRYTERFPKWSRFWDAYYAAGTVKKWDFSQVLKFNPYHEPAGKATGGRFTHAPAGRAAVAREGGQVAAGWYKTHGGHHLQVDESGLVVYGGEKSQGKPVDPKFLAAGPFKDKEAAHAATGKEGLKLKTIPVGTPHSHPALAAGGYTKVKEGWKSAKGTVLTDTQAKQVTDAYDKAVKEPSVESYSHLLVGTPHPTVTGWTKTATGWQSAGGSKYTDEEMATAVNAEKAKAESEKAHKELQQVKAAEQKAKEIAKAKGQKPAPSAVAFSTQAPAQSIAPEETKPETSKPETPEIPTGTPHPHPEFAKAGWKKVEGGWTNPTLVDTQGKDAFLPDEVMDLAVTNWKTKGDIDLGEEWSGWKKKEGAIDTSKIKTLHEVEELPPPPTYTGKEEAAAAKEAITTQFPYAEIKDEKTSYDMDKGEVKTTYSVKFNTPMEVSKHVLDIEKLYQQHGFSQALTADSTSGPAGKVAIGFEGTQLNVTLTHPAKSTQTLENIKNANTDNYKGKQELGTAKAMIKGQFPGQSITKDKISIDENTGEVVNSYSHTFYSSSKAEAALEEVIKRYEENGFTQSSFNPNTVVNGRVKFNLKNSQIEVEIRHQPLPPPPPPSAQLEMPLEAKEAAALPAAKAAAKEKYNAKQLEVKKKEYGEKFNQLMLEAKDIEAKGQNSKAKAALAKLGTIEKYMVKYGISPEDLATLKGQSYAKLQDVVKAEQEKAVALRVEAERAGRKIPGWSGSYVPWDVKGTPVAQEFEAKKAASEQHLKAHPGIYKGSHTPTQVVEMARAQVDWEQHEALQQLALTMVKASKLQEKGELDKATGLIEKAKQKAKDLGASEELLAGAVMQGSPAFTNLLTEPPVFKTKEQALQHLKEKAFKFHAVGYGEGNPIAGGTAEDYKQQYEQGKVDLAQAQAQFQLAKEAYIKAGGKASDFVQIDKQADVAAYKLYQEQKNAAQIAQQKAKDEVKELTYEHQKAQYYKGVGHKDALNAEKKLEEAKKAAGKAGLDATDIQEQVDLGAMKWSGSLSAMTESAKKNVTDALYKYHFSQMMNGSDHPETQQALVNMHHALQTEKKFYTKEDAKQWVKEAKESAKNAKQSYEAMKNLGATVQQAALAYDQQASSFEFPSVSQMLKVQSPQVEALNNSEKSAISHYKANGYKAINKAAGPAGENNKKVTSGSLVDSINNLDSAMAKVKIGKNVKLVRTMPSKYMWAQLGIKGSPTPEQLAQLKGKIYTEHAYSSTSINNDWTSAYSNAIGEGEIRMKIRAAKELHGVQIEAVTGHDNEKEVLLARGTVYLIRSAKKAGYGNSGIWEIEVDAIAQLPRKIT